MIAPYKMNGYNWIVDPEWLRHEYITLNKSARRIGIEIGTQKRMVLTWLNRFRIPKHQVGAANRTVVDHLNPGELIKPPVRHVYGKRVKFSGVKIEWLEQQYVELNKSMQMIADEIGTSRNTIKQWLRKANVPSKDLQRTWANHSTRMSGKGNPAWIDGNSRNYQRRLLERNKPDVLCEWCGAEENIQIHHIDHDRTNCQLDNLMWLCNHCNVIEARLWNLQQDGRVRVQRMDNCLTIEFGGN